jgi:hypothetical protein
VVKYFKAAFLNHWNMLAFGAGMAFGAISGHFDVIAPLVAAGEIAYLGLLGSHPRFQKYVDAQEAKEVRSQTAENAEAMVQRLRQGLPRELDQRFEALRARCQELRQIAQHLREPSAADSTQPLEEVQLSGLDRLLWVYLRLLYTQHMLERFFRRTTDADIERDIKNLERRLRDVGDDADPQKQRVRKALEDNLATSRERLANLQKARDNAELVRLEIDRLENKIRSVSELAINRQEPDFITSQVDQVAASMVQTERTMNELQFATGLPAEEAVPQMMERQVVRVEQ